MKQMNRFMMTILLMLGVSGMIRAQENHRERIRAYKTAHITQQMDLTVQEAEKFWPVYNAYDKEMFSLKVLKVKEEKKPNIKILFAVWIVLLCTVIIEIILLSKGIIIFKDRLMSTLVCSIPMKKYLKNLQNL